MFPYSEERFTADEEAVLRRYVTNLDQPVFALVNLPEVVKGALFARYSRSPKSLRRLFLDEFVGDLDISGDARSTRRSVWSERSSSTRRSSSSTATTRWHSWAVSTSPASSRPTCCRRCSSGVASWPTSSSPLATSRTTNGWRTVSTATTARPKSSTRRTGRASSARWTGCSTPTARSCRACRPGWPSASRNTQGTATSYTARRPAPSPSTRCAGSCRRRRCRTSGCTGPASPTSSCCCACARTHCPRPVTTPT